MKMQFVKAFCVLFSILLIPLFFILANYYIFDALKSFRQAYFFSQSVFVGLYKGASILDLKFEVYITMLISLMPLKPPKQKSQISLVFGMNALVPLGTI